MVKHIILWKLKDEFNTLEVKSQMKEKLEGLHGQIEGLLEIKVQIEKLESSNVDVMLYSAFIDEAALKNYATHEKHVFVADNFVRPFTELRSCIDYCEN
ncbi:MAG: Dabb family protein [Clostridia bacterium]|nr:Dabb family protein [Clostridia bacterium]